MCEWFWWGFGAAAALVDFDDGVGDLGGCGAGDANEVGEGDFEAGVVVRLEVDDRCVSEVGFDGGGATVVDE